MVWSTSGAKSVCLQVDNQSCLSGIACQTTNVQELPNAGIAAVSNQCLSSNSYDFVYNGDPNVSTYAWDFGADAVPATSSSSVPPTVSYLNPGPKKVSVVVTRNGCVSDSAIINFEVVPDPEANFSFSTGVSCQADGVSFQYTGIPVGPNQTYAWDFGADAIPATSSQPNPGTIMYASGGTKTVSLIVGYQGCIATSVQQVTINPGPVVNAGIDRSFCDGDGGVQVDATVSGGTAPYFYEWTCDDPGNCGISNAFAEDPIMNPNITQASETVVYYFQVTDVNGCVSNLDSVEIEVKAKPLADAGPDRDICAEGPGAFLNGGEAPGNQAPQPFTYQWLPADGLNADDIPNPFARPDTTTIYTLVVTSANGCSSDVTTLDTTSTVTVRVNELPIAEAGADTAICLNEMVQLQGSSSGGGPAYTYAWTPATPGTIDDASSPSPNVTPNFTTTFFLVVSSNGCDSYADSVEVIVDTKPTLSPGTDVSVCQGDSVQLDGSASGDPNGSNYNYQWTPASDLSADDVAKPMAAPKQTTTYTVVATSEHGCGSDARQVLVTVESTPVVFLLSTDTVICEGTEITLAADHGFKTPPSNPVSYSWTPEASITTSPFVSSVTVAPSTTTLYTVTASAPSGCATTDEILITVSPKVEALVRADTTQFCEGTSTQLYAEGGRGNASFRWLPGAGLSDSTIAEPVASPEVSTLYQVIITEGACADTASLDLEINPAPTADYLASQSSGCEGLEVNFMENSTNGTNYLWDFGDGSGVVNGQNPTYTYNTAGSYPVTLRVIGPGGCEDVITKTTVEISPSGTADFSSDPVAGAEVALPDAGVNFTDLSANGVSWYWDFGDGTISTEASPNHIYQSAGEYSVSLTVTDVNGCVSQIQYGPYIVFSPELAIPNLLTPNDDGVNDRFIVQYTGSESYNLEIFDRWGRSFFQSDAPQDAWEGTDQAGASAREGVYFYSLKIGEKLYNGSFTLMR
ncbi:MAG: PKD domain-containing protein [Cyanobacteria bacterium J06614_10]